MLMKKLLFISAMLVVLLSCNDDDDTAPFIPTLQDATEITNESFVINWDIEVQPANFAIDVALDNLFTTGFNSFGQPGEVRSVMLTGLDGNTEYFYRMRAINGSASSANSSFRSTTTLPDAPVALPATGVMAEEFVANWESVHDLDIYVLDVATDDQFAAFVDGYNGREIFGTSFLITSLQPGTTYYYRVRAQAQAESESSNTISVTTTN